MSFAGIAVGVGLAVTAGAAIYGTTTQAGIANSQLGLEQNQAQKQNQSFNQLQNLINNPQSFFSSPVYQAAFNQGTAAVSAQQNAGGFLGSSNAAGALQAYGQTFGQQQLLSQEQLLAGMSGTGFNPAAAGSSASNSAQLSAGNLASLGGLLAFFGNSGGGSSGGGFVPLNSSSLAGTTSGWGAGADAIVLP